LPPRTDDWAFTYGAGRGCRPAVEVRNSGSPMFSINMEIESGFSRVQNGGILEGGSIRPKTDNSS
jgi:hypothetical protein